MGKIIDFIAEETEGKSFASYKYSYDLDTQPRINYGEEEGLVNLKEYAESVQDPKFRNLTFLAQEYMKRPPLFRYFLDGSRMVYKVDDIQYGKKVFPIVAGQISVACCERKMQDDGMSFHSFGHIEEDAYSVLALPVTANASGVEGRVFFRNLCDKINMHPDAIRTKMQIRKILS